MASESRSYTIMGLLGVGGFGKVYRARLAGSSDFSKDVAIKVLHDAQPDDEMLKRFRDEARILGLIRDRAIVSVDPPTRLGNRWAVVMDFVDGVSCAELLSDQGALPPGVVIEIIGEVARVLHKAYHFEGPDGTRLELLHRDIKPGNVQVTPGGEIRLLDFGVARATFSAREALTQDAISGTPGYMAPERFSGIEGPSGDVYSLGVLMWVLLTAEKAGKRGPIDLDETATTEFEGELSEALALAARMRKPDHRDRLSARDIERECRTLRRRFGEPFLREWAELHAHTKKTNEQDVLVGSVLSDTLFTATYGDLDSTQLLGPGGAEDSRTTGRRSLVLGAFLASTTAAVTIVGITVLLGAGGLWWFLSPGPAPLVPKAVEVVALEQIPADDDLTPVRVSTGPEPAPEPQPLKRPPTPVPPASPAPVPAAPEPASPTPSAVESYPVAFRSVPWNAEVWVDGALIGKTPLNRAELSRGSHQIELRLGEQRVRKIIQVGRRSPDDYSWTAATDAWTAGFRSSR